MIINYEVVCQTNASFVIIVLKNTDRSNPSWIICCKTFENLPIVIKSSLLGIQYTLLGTRLLAGKGSLKCLNAWSTLLSLRLGLAGYTVWLLHWHQPTSFSDLILPLLHLQQHGVPGEGGVLQMANLAAVLENVDYAETLPVHNSEMTLFCLIH